MYDVDVAVSGVALMRSRTTDERRLRNEVGACITWVDTGSTAGCDPS